MGLLEEFLRRIEGFRIPVICGIWPLTSYRNAEFMVNELRVPVPERFMERMRRADNAEKASQEKFESAEAVEIAAGDDPSTPESSPVVA